MLNESIRDGVAVLTMANPPVNGLSHALRSALWAAVERLEADPTVRALVITGSGKAFSGGADIREFGKPESFAHPHLPALTQRIEACTKPVVAAVNHLALGGGLELALCCHHRVVADDAQLGLPEVNIGLLPGAGGTQRLPRALGLGMALQMITTGAPQRAAKLAALPGQALIDACVPAAELLDRAVALAQTVGTCPRLSERAVPVDGDALATARAQAGALPYPAPLACVEAVAAATDRPFLDGLKAEREGFERLMATEASAALRHAFFAERAVGKVPGIESNTARRPIVRVAVIGAGTMGSGIATACLMAGLQVDLIEPQAEALARGVAALEKHVQAQVDKGRLKADKAAALRANLTPSTADDALAQADMVIEAVFEDMALKQTVFRRLDAVCKPGAILASNTSTLDVDQIAAVTQRPADVIGLHFFSPAAVMKLLEVVRGAATANEVLATALDFGKRIGKTCVVSGVCDGFIGNRMLEPYLQQALFLLGRGLHASAGGPCHRGLRLRHGPVPHGRPGGQRRELACAPTAREGRQDRVAAAPGRRLVRSRPLRPENGRWLVRLRPWLAPGHGVACGRGADGRPPRAFGPPGACGERRRNRRPTAAGSGLGRPGLGR